MAGVRILGVVVLVGWIQLTLGETCYFTEETGQKGSESLRSVSVNTIADVSACKTLCNTTELCIAGEFLFTINTCYIYLLETSLTVHTDTVFFKWDCTNETMPVDCPTGRYGPRCTQLCRSRNCKTPSPVCDVTGSCSDGCREGWQNADCRIPCQDGTYGSNCSKSCDSRQCETAPVSCDHVTGNCAAGCREGWIGADCTEKCKPGTFGPDCSRCGHCDVTCNVGDGRCPGECLDGFSGERCDVDVRVSPVSPVTSGVIGGAVVMVVMLLLIGGLMMCLLKSGRLKRVPSTGTDSTEEGKTDRGDTGEISTQAHTSGVNDYYELNEVTREREEKSQYDVIQNKVYEHNHI